MTVPLETPSSKIIDLSWVEFSDQEDESCYECDKQAVWRLVYVQNCDCSGEGFPCCDPHGKSWEKQLREYTASGYKAFCTTCGTPLIDWKLEKI